MSLICKIGFHAWEGCKCSNCGKIRDEHHSWSKSQCSLCGRKILFRDNFGTFLNSFDKSFASWQPYQFNNYTGSLIFKFNTLKEAKNALSLLSYIHVASDNGELVSTKIIEYGYFKNESKSDVVIWGPSLTMEMWEEAKEKLSNAGGILFSSQKPKEGNSAIIKEGNVKPKIEKVKFVRDEQRGKSQYKIYSGQSKESAMEFLQKNPVTESFYYIIIETPEGNYARDIMGIYREDQN